MPFIDNPLLQPKSEDSIQQVHDYARDLAYLAIQEGMDPKIIYENEHWFGPHNPEYKVDAKNISLFRNKWGTFGIPLVPTKNIETMLNLLASFKYVDHTPLDVASNVARTRQSVYILTPKAFSLLEKPIRPPKIFISYRRIQSSAFALLIEARLRIAGVDNPIIDKSIPAGDDWEDWLKNKVEGCETFVCLVGPKTLGAQPNWVEKEIDWAAEARIISIWHGTYEGRVYKLSDAGDMCPPILKARQAIQVTDESAKGYETAVNELLNSLGYRTY